MAIIRDMAIRTVKTTMASILTAGTAIRIKNTDIIIHDRLP